VRPGQASPVIAVALTASSCSQRRSIFRVNCGDVVTEDERACCFDGSDSRWSHAGAERARRGMLRGRGHSGALILDLLRTYTALSAEYFFPRISLSN